MPVNGNIRKFRYDLSLNDEQIFEPLGDKLIELTKTKLIRILEEVIEESGQKNLVIDKIEINLGQIDINNLEILSKKFKNQLLLFFQGKAEALKLSDPKKEEEAILFFKSSNPYDISISDKSGLIAIEWGAYGVPETFLIHEKKILKKIIGPITSDLMKEIKELIDL